MFYSEIFSSHSYRLGTYRTERDVPYRVRYVTGSFEGEFDLQVQKVWPCSPGKHSCSGHCVVTRPQSALELETKKIYVKLIYYLQNKREMWKSGDSTVKIFPMPSCLVQKKCTTNIFFQSKIIAKQYIFNGFRLQNIKILYWNLFLPAFDARFLTESLETSPIKRYKYHSFNCQLPFANLNLFNNFGFFNLKVS